MADDLRVREYIDFVMEHDAMRPGRAGAEQAPSKRANRESEGGAGSKGNVVPGLWSVNSSSAPAWNSTQTHKTADFKR